MDVSPLAVNGLSRASMADAGRPVVGPDEDARYMIIDGRRWRRSDPSIPPTLCKQLTNELMSARRAVKAAKATGDENEMLEARSRVHDAKLALGERGQPWWEAATPLSLDERLGASIRCLLRHRGAGNSMCPSEAARIVGGLAWKSIMPRTQAVAWQLEEVGWLIVSQQGERVRQPTSGPLRLKQAVLSDQVRER